MAAETPTELLQKASTRTLQMVKGLPRNSNFRVLLRVFIFMELFILVLYLTNQIFLFQGGEVRILLPTQFHKWVWELILEDFTFEQTLLAAMPIMLTAIGASFNERAGIINIGLEGIMIFGAWTAVYVSYLTGNPWLGVFWAMIAGGIAGLLHAVMTITFKAEQIVTGVAINLLAVGITQVLTDLVYTTLPKVNQIPSANLKAIPIIGWIFNLFSFRLFGIFPDIVGEISDQHWLITIGLLIIPLAHILLFRTTFGLRIRVIGEEPDAAATAGINVRKYQYYAVIIGGMLGGLGGSVLSVANSGRYDDNIVGGQGFIALAAMIFGKWTVIGSALSSILFGYFFSLQTNLSISLPSFEVPPPLINMLPYIVAMLALAGFIGKAYPPKNIGKPYDPTN